MARFAWLSFKSGWLLFTAVQGFESVSDVSGTLAKIENRAPWDGGEGTVDAADEFDLADLMGDDDKKEEL